MYPGLFVYFKKHLSTFYQFLYSDKDNHYYLRLPKYPDIRVSHTLSWAISFSVLSEDVRALCPLSEINSIWCMDNLVVLTPFRLIFQKIEIFSGNNEFWITTPKYRKSQNKNVSLMSSTNRRWKMRFHVVVVLRQQATKKRESSLGLQNALFIIILPLLLPSILPKLATV